MTQNNYQRFDAIDHLPLRVFNRTVLLQNIFTDFGKDAAAEYGEMFDDKERSQMVVMQGYIKAKGVDEVRKMVTRDLEVVYDADSGE